MSLENQVKQIMDNFDEASSEKILEVIGQIKPSFKNPEISEYLQGKLQKIQDISNEDEKKKQCKALTPYLDWYLQGQ